MTEPTPSPDAPRPSFREASRFWLKLGLVSFGGPSGQIALMHAEVVERKKWVTEEQFLAGLNYCMLLPGPEAHKLAIYLGWLLHRTRGGLVAGIGFVLPAAVLLWALSWLYVAYGTVPALAGLFHGLKPAVAALVVAALLRIGGKALRSPAAHAVAAAAFLALFAFHLPFPLVLGEAALAGFAAGRGGRSWFLLKAAPGPAAPSVPPSWQGEGRRLMRVGGLGLLAWLAPVALLAWALGPGQTLVREGWFFAKASLIGFGGAYAVLPYVGQQAVEHFGWLQPGQMIDGLGLAETTPGPLVIALEFVGFLGAWNQPGTLPPLLAATLGAGLTAWMTFVPSFVWIFLGAPHVARLSADRRTASILGAVTAAVVGVILNLAVWFALHTFFPEARGGKIDLFAIGVAVAAFIALVPGKRNPMAVIAAAAAAGLMWEVFNP
ncbi:chromate transporter [Verrucomicrobium sp. GAS474]|uniref:chromate efflux transporter n=1 Tax=Verrucomicrobium sp. GAS474 TaxID=1882831 RepID=UPI00087AEB5A|nr:chromate efflux transporter [Verrucomicrobium sp. GAS474]SDU00279.1 chromate transporter [Verrucomicrobium sp. GAS474]